MLEWVAISYSRGSSRPRDRTHIPYVSCTAGRFFTLWAFGETHYFNDYTYIVLGNNLQVLYFLQQTDIIVVFFNWVIWKCNTEFNIIPVYWCINFYAFFVPFQMIFYHNLLYQ